MLAASQAMLMRLNFISSPIIFNELNLSTKAERHSATFTHPRCNSRCCQGDTCCHSFWPTNHYRCCRSRSYSYCGNTPAWADTICPWVCGRIWAAFSSTTESPSCTINNFHFSFGQHAHKNTLPCHRYSRMKKYEAASQDNHGNRKPSMRTTTYGLLSKIGCLPHWI
jgi:hypothetical protein